MASDAFSKRHPMVNFIFFLGAIGFGVVIQHPAYLAAGFGLGTTYYLLLKGRKGTRMLLGLLPLFVIMTLINPLFNVYGATILFHLFGRPYTLEALYYGAAIAAVFVVMLIWFGCYNEVLTSDKFTSLFGNLIPSLSLLLVMVLRLIPNLMRKTAQLSGARKSIGKGSGENATSKEKLTDGMTILSAMTDWALEGSVVTAGDVIGYMGHTGYSPTENVNNIEVTHLHWGLELIFDEARREQGYEIWLDLYPLTRFLAKHTQEAVKVEDTKEWVRSTKIVDPAVEEYLLQTQGAGQENSGE